MKRFLAGMLFLLVNACGVLNDVSLNQQVCIDSNVSAFVYVDDIKTGQTPFCGFVKRGLNTKIVLKANGYEITEVPLKKGIHRNVIATLNPPDLLIGTGYNIVSLSIPSGMDLTYSSQGRWIEYQPYSYYVEMYSSNKHANLSDLQIKAFALKNFYAIKSGEYEYLNALSVLSRLSQEKIITVVRGFSTPVLFAEEILRLSDGGSL